MPVRLNKHLSASAQRTCLLAGLLLGVAGCAAPLPRLVPPVPAQWQHRIASDKATPADLHGWWHAFGDTQLNHLVDQALADNLDVAQAVERLRASRALNAREHAHYLPNLTVSTHDVVEPSASASYFLVGFDANWELGLFGRAEATRRESQGALDASVADLRTAQVSLIAEVVREWIDLRTAQQQEHLLLQIRQLRQQQWQWLQTRQHLQMAAPIAVDQAQAALAQADAALAAPRQTINACAQRLALLLGLNQPDPAWLQTGPEPRLGDWQLDSTPADMLRSRPEIARAEADVLQAAGAQALAHADMFPSLGIGGSIDWATDIDSNKRSTHAPNHIVSIGPEISIPLFDWGIRLAAEHARDHELKASVLAYRQAVLLGVSEVETALGTLQQQKDREQRSADAWQALQRVNTAMQTRVHLQLSSPLERADSQIAADQAALELSEARAGHCIAYVALFKALGGAPLPASDSPEAASSSADHSAQARH